MATLNGQEVSLYQNTFQEIGRKLLEASPSKDGRGLCLQLTLEEERDLAAIAGMKVGYSLFDLMKDAMREGGCLIPDGLEYKYTDFRFTT